MKINDSNRDVIEQLHVTMHCIGLTSIQLHRRPMGRLLVTREGQWTTFKGAIQ